MMLNIIILLIVVSVFGMVSMLGYQALQGASSDITADLDLNESITMVQDTQTRYPALLDSLLVFVFVGLWAAGIVAAVMSDAHPMVFGFVMLLMVFLVIVAGILGNYFEETYQDSELSSITTSFPMTNFILTHNMQLTVAIVISIALALMGKNRAV